MRFFRFIILGILILGISFYSESSTKKRVLLAVYFDNPDYRIARESFRRNLKKEALKRGVEIEFLEINTQGDEEKFISKLKEIAPTVDLIFTTGTPNSLAVKEAGINRPVIFSAVANPVGAGLVKTLKFPGTNFTGSHCRVPESIQLRVLLLTLPSAKKIGILYNPHDPAPVSQANNWKKAIAEKGLECVEYFVPEDTDSSEKLAQVTKEMLSKLTIDVLVTTADAKVSPYGEGMIKVANEKKVPTYVSLTQLVKKGALVSLGFNFSKAAQLINVPQALKILIEGKKPSEIPVETFTDYRLVINKRTAKLLGIKLSSRVLKTASEIVE